MKKPTDSTIVLTPNERAYLARKFAIVEQGEQARTEIVAIVSCIVERDGKPVGTYNISPDGSTLTPTS